MIKQSPYIFTAMLGAMLLGYSIAAYAENWQITGYYPQIVKAGDPAGGVTLNGAFSTYQGNRKVKLGGGSNVLADLTSHVIAWTQGQIKVLMPSGITPGQYWLAVHTPGNGLLAKGAQTLVVIGTLNLQTESSGNSTPQLMVKAKELLKIKLPELEIKSISRLPSQVCPDRNYNAVVSIANHGDLQAKFYLCAVGSHTHGCQFGQSQVHEIKGKSTRTLTMSLKPASPFFENGKWHGKVFLGKVPSPSEEIKITTQGQGGQSSSTSNCNVGVSTSWTDAPGLSAGVLFCDQNMNNHLVKLEPNSSAMLCNPGLKKKLFKGNLSPDKKAHIASYTPRKLAPKLVLRNVNASRTLNKKAGKSFDLVFPVRNTGNAASGRTPYSISCKVLHGAKCPFNRKPGTLMPIKTGQNSEIKLKGLNFAAGDYELKLKLKNSGNQTLKLKVAAARVTPEAAKGAPRLKLNNDTNGQQHRLRLRLP